MRRQNTALLVILFCVAMLSPTYAQALQDAEKLKKGVVRIIIPIGFSGTGFILNERIIVTNHHVIEVASGLIQVFPSNSTTGIDVKVIWSSKKLDIALLQSRTPLPGTPVTLTTQLNDADKVVAVGFPAVSDNVTDGRQNIPTFTEGIVSRIMNNPNANRSWDKAIQHDANTHGGNSGGPLVDNCDRVVGINTLKHEKASSVNIASHISELIDKALKPKNIRYSFSDKKCFTGGGNDTQAREKAEQARGKAEQARQQVYQLTQNVLWISAIGGILLLTTIGLALRKPRERIIKIAQGANKKVEQHSRKMINDISQVFGSNKSAPNHLILSGFDKQGHKVHLKLNRNKLADFWGVDIGRAPQLVSVHLPDDTVSRRHARFIYYKGAYSVEDLNSTYGTFINGEKLEPCRAAVFQMGDEVALGDIQLIISKF